MNASLNFNVRGIVAREYDKNFVLLKRKYQVFLFVPILGGILAITPIKSIAISFNNLFGLDAYKGVLDQEGGLAFVMVSCVSLPVVE